MANSLSAKKVKELLLEIEELRSRLSENEETISTNQHLSDEIVRLKETEKALHLSEEHFSLAVRAANLGIWDHVYNNKVVKMIWSDQMLSMHGFPTGTKITPQIWSDSIHPADLKSVSRNRRIAIEEHLVFYCEYRVIWPDGAIHWILVIGKATYYEVTNRILRMNGIASDITGSKQAEKEIRKSKEKLEIALENGNIGSWDWDLITDEVIWDKRIEKMFGLKPGTFEQTYEAFENYIHEEDLPHFRDAINQTLKLSPLRKVGAAVLVN